MNTDADRDRDRCIASIRTQIEDLGLGLDVHVDVAMLATLAHDLEDAALVPVRSRLGADEVPSRFPVAELARLGVTIEGGDDLTDRERRRRLDAVLDLPIRVAPPAASEPGSRMAILMTID